MVEIFYCNIPEKLDDSAVPFLSDYRQKRLLSISNEKSRRESICAELLLEKAVFPKLQRPLPIAVSEHGKPFFENSDIHFSLSHSGGLVACATGNTDLGLDIQELRTFDMRVAEKFFAQDELAYIKTAMDSEAAFFEVWSKKESRVKATGRGLKQALSSFSVFDSSHEYWHTVLGNTHFALCVPGTYGLKVNITNIKLL